MSSKTPFKEILDDRPTSRRIALSAIANKSKRLNLYMLDQGELKANAFGGLAASGLRDAAPGWKAAKIVFSVAKAPARGRLRFV